MTEIRKAGSANIANQTKDSFYSDICCWNHSICWLKQHFILKFVNTQDAKFKASKRITTLSRVFVINNFEIPKVSSEFNQL